MYYDGQIVFDLKKRKPVRVGDGGERYAWIKLPKKSTHFIASSANGYKTVSPKTIFEAKKLLEIGAIFPAPCSYEHCFQCHAWLDDTPMGFGCRNKNCIQYGKQNPPIPFC